MPTILPQSISKNPHIAAFELAFAEKLAALDVSAVLLYLTEQVAESALDTLIAQWGLSGHGVEFTSYTVAQKRKLLNQAGLVNQKRGTLWVLRYLFDAAGFPEIEIVEAAELNAPRYRNGTYFRSGTSYHGLTWLWAQYQIRIQEDVAEITITTAVLDALDRLLLEFTPARCAHIGFSLVARPSETLALADSLSITITP
jgi:P2-related tail formation protein